MGYPAIDIGNSNDGQDIKIPKEMMINDNKVYLKKVGNIIYLIPFHSPWQNLVDSLGSFTPDFMENRDQPEDQNRASLD